MKLTTAVSAQINSAIELGATSVRALIGAEAPVAEDKASRPNLAENLISETAALDARLDAIRRAGL